MFIQKNTCLGTIHKDIIVYFKPTQKDKSFTTNEGWFFWVLSLTAFWAQTFLHAIYVLSL